MSREGKEYEAFRIFEQIAEEAKGGREARKEGTAAPFFASAESAPYYEIEYDSCPLPGVGKFVLKSEPTRPRERDAVRERFDQMREIARERRHLVFSSSKFFDERTRRENAEIFYRQGMFMKDFEDTYERVVPYSAYFPCYQMMGYEQLRTYFTWRTQVRQGMIPHISLSYAFLYLYELINNIGTEGPQDALERLVSFWEAYRVYDASVDKYVLKWLKDYHIYYELPQSFKVFTEEYGLTEFYPGIADSEDDFALFCSVSKYDLRKSVFYSEGSSTEGSSSEAASWKRNSSLERDGIEKNYIEGTQKEGGNSGRGEGTGRKMLVRDCFSFTMDRLKMVFEEHHIGLEESIFQPVRGVAWMPFREALFYPTAPQRDRQVIFSEKESYQCIRNHWTHSTAITSESGKRLVGYIMKQMEAVLRKLTNYKYKLSANLSMLSDSMAEELKKAEISLEKEVTDAVTDFYREANRTVVRIDAAALEKIRQEALVTQEKLIVPEETAFGESLLADSTGGSILEENLGERSVDRVVLKESFVERTVDGVVLEKGLEEMSVDEVIPEEGFEKKSVDEVVSEEGFEERVVDGRMWESSQEDSTPWDALRAALTETELSALQLLAEDKGDIKQFADEHGVMLEVLADGINEKAVDLMGDSLLDGEFMIYEDYIAQVKEMVGAI